jgi:hypothetical protein
MHCAFIALSILDLMHLVDVTLAVDHIKQCANLDGAFGTSPGAESHSGQVFTCVGALSIARRLDLVDVDRLGAWLSERQLPNGGLNGRPEKLEDVCYSWWVLSSLAMVGRLHWIDGQKLSSFILRCQVSISWCMVYAFLTEAGSREWWHVRSSRRHGRCVSHRLWCRWLEPAWSSWACASRSCIVSVHLRCDT